MNLRNMKQKTRTHKKDFNNVPRVVKGRASLQVTTTDTDRSDNSSIITISTTFAVLDRISEPRTAVSLVSFTFYLCDTQVSANTHTHTHTHTAASSFVCRAFSPLHLLSCGVAVVQIVRDDSITLSCHFFPLVVSSVRVS